MCVCVCMCVCSIHTMSGKYKQEIIFLKLYSGCREYVINSSITRCHLGILDKTCMLHVWLIREIQYLYAYTDIQNRKKKRYQ